MTRRLYHLWQALRESLWFIPALFVLGSIGLALGLIDFDAEIGWKGAKKYPFIFGTGAEGSRSMLTAIAGSMLTVAGLTFTLTLSALTQASSQYSPRVLRNFMRDRLNQLVMGYFVGAFTYCLLVLRTIRGGDEALQFVPSISVLVGLILALGGVGALILFIHHIAESLQASTLIRHIARETTHAIEDFFPDELGEPVVNEARRQEIKDWVAHQTSWRPIAAPVSGYIQSVMMRGLLTWANKHNAVISFERAVGEFVVAGSLLMRIQREADVDEAAINDLTDQVSIGKHRTISQDVGFGIQQLVDVALKALSPGINDTTTAITAVDYLSVIVGKLAQRHFPVAERTDEESDQLRALVKAPDFASYVRLGFDLIRVNAKGNHAVLRRLLRALSDTAEAASPDRIAVLREQAELVLEQAESSLASEYEKQQVRVLFKELQRCWNPTKEPA